MFFFLINALISQSHYDWLMLEIPVHTSLPVWEGTDPSSLMSSIYPDEDRSQDWFQGRHLRMAVWILNQHPNLDPPPGPSFNIFTPVLEPALQVCSSSNGPEQTWHQLLLVIGVLPFLDS